MSQMVRIALDAMGGDHGPAVVVAGAELALARRPESTFLFFGNSVQVEPLLAKHPALQSASRVVHAEIAVRMEDKPSQALRHGRRKSSMWLAIDAVKKKEADMVGIGRQHRRPDGDVEVRSENARRDRAAGDRGVVADPARRIDRARRRRLDRRGRRASRRSRGHGRGHRPHSAWTEAADGRSSQYRRRGGEGSRAGPRSRPHAARTANARPRLCRLRRR